MAAVNPALLACLASEALLGQHIVLADDHPMCRSATRLALQFLAGEYAFVEAGSMQAAREAAPGAALAILDLMLPDMWGLAGLLGLCSEASPPPVLIVSGHDDPEYQALAAAAGASGFVSKNEDLAVLAEAAKALLSGGTWFARAHPDSSPRIFAFESNAVTEDYPLAARIASLSRAERRVLAALGDGSLNKQIAHELDLSEITIKQHVKSILRKTGAANRTQAALMIQFFVDKSRQQDAFARGSLSDAGPDR